MLRTTKLTTLLIVFSCFFMACENDDEPTDFDAPSITFESDAITQKPGETATLKVTFNAPAGIKSLEVSVDGGDKTTVQVTDGSTNQTVDYTFDVPLEKDGGKSTWGTVYNFAFTATDKQNIAETGTASATITATFVPDNPISVPGTYAFTRNSETTVSFSGQTDRLNQLSEIKTLMGNANNGQAVSAQALLDMYANTGDNGGGNFSFTSTKQLKNKTFASAVETVEGWLNEMATNSDNPGTASSGTPGLLTRVGKNKTILVDANGREYAQLIEKGLMGSVFLNQVYNTYLTDDRTGNDVQNISLRDGKNYTDMEHHWDEAFGYFGVPVDFPTTTTNRFWGNYSNGRDALIGSNQKLMDAYIAGRTAIVNFDYDEKDAQRDILYENLELVAAATAIHYINATLDNIGSDQGEMHHALSEAWAFIEALRYSPRAKMTQSEIDDILNTDIGINFYNVTITGLNDAKDAISSKFGLDNVKNDL
ncbi:DUF4856 domain-containing protein [Fulvivirgaceae bacterium BMA10]|uniref:DUF4856 domain-containing protein n=1 Tax=Splendidivirga corallicola TaxID=3051826 RepID=A0ABT8KZI9_9BACT|nr:DUF4856 domain-containing protein [Fulvivirgaceae bacterium BMA10]